MSGGGSSRQATRLAGVAGDSEHQSELRHPGLRAAGGIAARITAPVVAKRGGLLARLKAEWTAVVGTELAATTWPEGLGRDGTVQLRVVPGRALELQHRAPLVIERINLYFGRALVSRLVIRQGPLPYAGKPAAIPAERLSTAETSALAAQLDTVADAGLRDALAGLGRVVLAKDRGSD
jgi:hypothetical protein